MKKLLEMLEDYKALASRYTDLPESINKNRMVRAHLMLIQIEASKLLSRDWLSSVKKEELASLLGGFGVKEKDGLLLYNVANYVLDWELYEVAEELYHQAYLICCENGSVMQIMFSEDTGNINSTEQLQAAVLCNWATIYREGLGKEKDWDKAIELYEESASLGMLVSKYNAANVSTWKVREGHASENDYQKAITYYAEVTIALDEKQDVLDFSDNEDALQYRSADNLASLLDEKKIPVYAKAFSPPKDIASLLPRVYKSVSHLYARGMRVGKPSAVHKICPENSMLCCGLLLAQLSSYVMNNVNRDFLRTAKKGRGTKLNQLPFYSGSKELLEDFSSTTGVIIEKGLGDLAPIFDSTELWASILSNLGWRIDKRKKEFWAVIDGEEWLLKTPDLDLMLPNLGLIMSELSLTIDEESPFMMLPSLGEFISLQRNGNDADETYLPVIVHREGEVKIVSLASATEPGWVVKQFEDATPFGTDPSYSTYGQNLIIAFNETIFGHEYDKDKEVVWMGDIKESAIPTPNGETFCVFQFYNQDLPFLGYFEHLLLKSSELMLLTAFMLRDYPYLPDEYKVKFTCFGKDSPVQDWLNKNFLA